MNSNAFWFLNKNARSRVVAAQYTKREDQSAKTTVMKYQGINNELKKPVNSVATVSPRKMLMPNIPRCGIDDCPEKKKYTTTESGIARADHQ